MNPVQQTKRGHKAKSSRTSPRDESFTLRHINAKESLKVKRIEELMQADVSLDEKLLETQSKKRSAKLAKGVLPESEAVLRLTDQLRVRDRYIEVLKSKLIDVFVEGKGLERESMASKDRTIQHLLSEKAELIKQLQVSEEQNQENSVELQSLRQGISTDKENLELLLDGLTEETERLKGELQAKDKILMSVKQDMSQLSLIIQEMTALNLELNDKVQVMNSDMEKKNVDYFNAMSKAQHIEDTEKTLAEQIGERGKLEERVRKLTEGTSRLQELEEAAIEMVKLLSPEDDKPINLETLKSFLPIFKGGFIRKQPESMLLKEKAKQLEMELRSKSHDLSRVTANESFLKKRLETQQTEYNFCKSEGQLSIDRLTKTVKSLKSGFDGIAERSETLGKEYAKVAGEAQKLGTKLAGQQARVEKANEAVRKATENEAKSVHALKEGQQQLLQMKLSKTSQDSALLVREQKVKQDSAKMKGLNEEIWKRDTQLLKKTGEIMKLEDTIETMKMTLQQNTTRAKVSAATESIAISRALEEKEKEITVLKNMLRHPDKKWDKAANRFLALKEEGSIQALDALLVETKLLDNLQTMLRSGETPSAELIKKAVPSYIDGEAIEPAIAQQVQELVDQFEVYFQKNRSLIAPSTLRTEARAMFQFKSEEIIPSADFLQLVKTLLLNPN